jgi:hypothetical protein
MVNITAKAMFHLSTGTPFLASVGLKLWILVTPDLHDIRAKSPRYHRAMTVKFDIYHIISMSVLRHGPTACKSVERLFFEIGLRQGPIQGHPFALWLPPNPEILLPQHSLQYL